MSVFLTVISSAITGVVSAPEPTKITFNIFPVSVGKVVITRMIIICQYNLPNNKEGYQR